MRGYGAQHHVEIAFRQIADSESIAVRPKYHWTDHSIRIRVLCWMLALALCCLLQMDLSRLSMDGSIPSLLQDLTGIREVDAVGPEQKAGGELEVRTTLTEMSAEQKSLYDLLQLPQCNCLTRATAAIRSYTQDHCRSLLIMHLSWHSLSSTVKSGQNSPGNIRTHAGSSRSA